MLNSFGKLAVVEVAVYIPVALVAFYVTLRYASTNRRRAWVFLLTFAICKSSVVLFYFIAKIRKILVRSVGAILTIVSQHESNPSNNLLTTAGILQILGLSFLLLTTHSLVSAM